MTLKNGTSKSPDSKGWASFRYRPFRLYISGSALSWTGDWLDLTTLNWATLQMTGSPLDLALINACRMFPVFLISFPAGMLADRFDRRKVVLWLQVLVMALTFFLAFILYQGVSFSVFAAVVFLRSTVNAMVVPIRNSLASNLVPMALIGNATAIQTATMNLARILGPALAGWLLTFFTVPQLFFVNGLSFIVVLYTLLQIHPETAQVRSETRKAKAMATEVYDFILSRPELKALLALSVFPMIFGFPYTTMMPLFVRDLYGMGPETLGGLMSAAALGALLGSSRLAATTKLRQPGKWLILSIVIFGAALMSVAFVGLFPFAYLALFIVGASSQVYRTVNRMAFQILVPDHLRGRVLSIAIMDRGFVPIGAMLVGVVAEQLSTRLSLIYMGLSCIIVCVTVFLLQRSIWKLSFEEPAD